MFSCSSASRSPPLPGPRASCGRGSAHAGVQGTPGDGEWVWMAQNGWMIEAPPTMLFVIQARAGRTAPSNTPGSCG